MLRGTVILGVSLVVTLSVFACESEDPVTRSEQGESCDNTADCAKGLSCFGGICQLSDANVEMTTNVCKPIQCEKAQDCCDSAFAPSASCTSYREQCDLDSTTYASYCTLAKGPACECNEDNYACEDNLCRFIECTSVEDCCVGFTRATICTTYDDYCTQDSALYAEYCALAKSPECVCNDTTQACNDSVCVTLETCQTNTDCNNGVCGKDGICVTCETDSDCNTGYRCTDANRCVRPQCATDSDCPVFSQCQDDKTCKSVGCASDRECMAHTGSYLALCNQDAKPVPTCEIACKHDAECRDSGNPLGQCVSGRCKNPGCETDEECKIVLSDDPRMNETLYPGIRAICMATD